MQIDIEIDDRAVLAALGRLSEAVDDLTPAMRSIAGVLASAAEDAFEAEADPATGTPWAPLTETTQRRPVDRAGTLRGAHPILQVSAQLATSIQSEWGADYAAAGTNLVYAATHQFGAQRGQYGTTRRGAPIPWGDVPSRPFLGLGEQHRADVLDIIERHLALAAR